MSEQKSAAEDNEVIAVSGGEQNFMGGLYLTLYTLDEDKDWDTAVYIDVLDPAGVSIARMGERLGPLSDHSDRTIDMYKAMEVTPAQIQAGSLVIRIEPNGHDNWRFWWAMVGYNGDEKYCWKSDRTELSHHNKRQAWVLTHQVDPECVGRGGGHFGGGVGVTEADPSPAGGLSQPQDEPDH